MPTYEYQCRSCREHLEQVQAFTDDPLTICPACGGELRKVFGNVGIVFKGSGFYKTDSRSTSTASTAPGGSDHDTTSAPTGEKSAATPSTSDTSSTADAAKTTPSPTPAPAAAAATSSGSGSSPPA